MQATPGTSSALPGRRRQYRGANGVTSDLERWCTAGAGICQPKTGARQVVHGDADGQDVPKICEWNQS